MNKISRIFLLAACLLLLTACGQFEEMESEETGEDGGYDYGAVNIENPVYKTESIDVLEEPIGTVLYVASCAMEPKYQELADTVQAGETSVMEGTGMIELVGYVQGPPIAIFQHEELVRNPVRDGGFLPRYWVPFLEEDTGEWIKTIELTQFHNEIATPHVWPTSLLKSLAHLTSPETPLYVVVNGSFTYYVIGDTAYSFDAEPGLDYLPEIVTEGFDIKIIAILV